MCKCWKYVSFGMEMIKAEHEITETTSGTVPLLLCHRRVMSICFTKHVSFERGTTCSRNGIYLE